MRSASRVRAAGVLAAVIALVLAPASRAQQQAKAEGASAKIEPALMSWSAMSEVATGIATAVDAKCGTPGSATVIVLTDERALADMATRRAVLETLSALTQDYTRLKGAAARQPTLRLDIAAGGTPGAEISGGLTAVAGLMQQVAGIFSMLQTSIKVSGVDVSSNAGALANMVAGRLRSPGSVRLAGLTPLPPKKPGTPEAKGTLGEALSALARARAGLSTTVFETDDGKNVELRLDTLLKALIAPGTPPEESLAARLSAAEALAMTPDGALFLVVKPIVMGGTNLERNGVFTVPSVSHAGGAVATFTLVTKEGEVRAADTFWSYDGYAKNPVTQKVTSDHFKHVPPPKRP